MDAWLRDLIIATASGLKALGEATWQRIQWVYNVIVAVGISVRLGWGFLYAAARFKLGKLISLAQQGYLTLYWLVWIRIPQVINYATDVVVQFTVNLIVELRNEVRQGFSFVVNWALQQLTSLLGLIAQFRDWAVARLIEIFTLLDHIGELVFTLLTSPQRMAKWLLGALFREALQFADDHADQFVDWIQRRSIYYAGRAASRIEDVLVRFL